MKGRLKGLLEIAAVVGLALLPIAATAGGAVLGIVIAKALATGLGALALAGAGAVGAYAGFIAGYTAVSQSPIRLAGSAPRSSPAHDLGRAALLPFRGAAKVFSGLKGKFNSAGKPAPGAGPSAPPSPPKPTAPGA